MLILLSFIIGTACASFITLCAWRLPAHQSIITPASHCDLCHHQLQWFDLIPIVSYLITHGKCRYCGIYIPKSFWYGEIIGGLAGSLLYTLHVPPSFYYIMGLLFWLSMTDVFFRIIYPWPTFFLASPLLIIHYSSFHWWAALIIGLLLGSVAYFTEAFGAGDVELLVLFTLALGLYSILWVLTLACSLCLLHYGIKRSLGRKTNPEIPFVPYLATGFMTVSLLIKVSGSS